MAVRSTAGNGGVWRDAPPRRRTTRRRVASPCGHKGRGYTECRAPPGWHGVADRQRRAAAARS